MKESSLYFSFVPKYKKRKTRKEEQAPQNENWIQVDKDIVG